MNEMNLAPSTDTVSKALQQIVQSTQLLWVRPTGSFSLRFWKLLRDFTILRSSTLNTTSLIYQAVSQSSGSKIFLKIEDQETNL